MKLLIIGGNGMAGHILVRYFRQKPDYHVFYTSRDIEDEASLVLDVTDGTNLDTLIETVRPQVIINAAGILNEEAERAPLEAYQVNAWLPHQLRRKADHIGAKVIHISTDCVFSGKSGKYIENDKPDGTSTYSVTKALGELKQHNPHLTIRTSIVGPEIRPHGIGLLEWFLKQEGEVKGYKRVYWNGVTTLELAKAIEYYVQRPIYGLIHLSYPIPISKYELLNLFQQAFGKLDVNIVPDEKYEGDKSLVNTREDADYRVKPYPAMLEELADWMKRQ
ncbi:dTDP-4-dehydrorhamnose reductase family protein [Paenibacillus arenosi]|uniref:dTDP-4-dehydrorhamnose reductase n=1 Tax=Paenibacillus arenosi TaxID=2774142 RepID=A0ABR9B4B9_9BACL|nr:SDR family oxidoreductase [Paenibacillus arenosi]MBD8500272.1 SDR family oxidoreductase [Paenibacillus arenosi]